jgi:hypothetical protein
MLLYTFQNAQIGIQVDAKSGILRCPIIHFAERRNGHLGMTNLAFRGRPFRRP